MAHKIILFFSVLIQFFNLTLIGQNQAFPNDYFQNPLDIPLKLSGNFGELRDNHFHSGLDYKTQQREGFNVYASGEGYISRVKISQWGYGKAIYITHPNGFTTVYGHLKNLYETLENHIEKLQYEKRDYEVEIFPKPNEFPIKKGQIIGLSGNTGSSGGPHLHFEIRDTYSQFPLNPLLFGFKIEDHIAPQIQSLFAYPLSTNAQVNQLAIPIQINLKKGSNNIYYSDTVYALGEIGFAVNAFDQQDGDVNRNGIFSMILTLDGKEIFKHELNKFSFDESKYINLHIDYEYFMKFNSRLQKCFVEPFNFLSTYQTSPEKGVVNIIENKKYDVEIKISDFQGNMSIIHIPIVGLNSEITLDKPQKKGNYLVIAKESKSIDLNKVNIYFPKYTFYSDNNIDISQNSDGSIQIHEDIIPLTKNYYINFDISSFDKETQKHLYVAKVNNRGSLYYIPSEIKDQKLTGKAKTLGKYRIAQDFKAPIISPLNFQNEQWVSNLEMIQVKISDELSGIKSYDASINNEWILMEWNHNERVLTYRFKDKVFKDSKLNFNLTVTDNAQNTKTYSATLYRASK